MPWFLKRIGRKALLIMALIFAILFALSFVEIWIGCIGFFIAFVCYRIVYLLRNHELYFIQHPALTNLKRNYDSAYIGASACYRKKNDSDIVLNWALPELSLYEIELILKRYYSLVEQGGIIYLYLEPSEITLDKSVHRFVYSILHQWTFPSELRLHGLRLFVRNPIWCLKLLRMMPLCFRSKHYTSNIDAVKDYIISMETFLKERGINFILVADDNKLYKENGLCIIPSSVVF